MEDAPLTEKSKLTSPVMGQSHITSPLLQCTEHTATLFYGVLAKNAQPDPTDEETSDKVQTERYSTKLSSQRKTGIFPGKVVQERGCL